MVKTVSSNGGSEDSIPGWDAEISHASWLNKQTNKQKTQKINRSNIVTNSVDFKNDPHQKRGAGERKCRKTDKPWKVAISPEKILWSA